MRRRTARRVSGYGPKHPESLGPVTFEAQQRELIAILGPNASGKSTLLKLLGGVVKPLSGRVEIDGTEVGGLDLRTRAQKNHGALR